MTARVLERTGATVRAWGEIYKAVVQSVLLYGRESWVVTREMIKLLTAFHHWSSLQILGMMAKRGSGREWKYPAVKKAIGSAGIHPIGVYIKKWKTTIE